MSTVNLERSTGSGLVVPVRCCGASAGRAALIGIRAVTTSDRGLFLGNKLIDNTCFAVNDPTVFDTNVVLVYRNCTANTAMFSTVDCDLPIVITFGTRGLVPITRSVHTRRPSRHVVVYTSSSDRATAGVRSGSITSNGRPGPLIRCGTNVCGKRRTTTLMTNRVIIPGFDLLSDRITT